VTVEDRGPTPPRDGLTLTTVGTGVAIPSAERGPTCHLLRTVSGTVVVDLGSGALQKLAGHGADLLSIDALFLSHAHLDHVADLFPALFALRITGMERARPLDIFASAPCLERIHAVNEAWGKWTTPDETQVRWHTVAPGETLQVAGLDVRVGAVDHDPTSVGFAFEAGSTGHGRVRLALPGDTGPCDGLRALCEGADLAVLECSVPQGLPLPGHLQPSDVVEVARDAGVRAVALVHRYVPAIVNGAADYVAAHLDIPVHAPSDGWTRTLEPA
jgi:ribonuclease BN (tRNA processing enzyme)